MSIKITFTGAEQIYQSEDTRYWFDIEITDHPDKDLTGKYAWIESGSEPPRIIDNEGYPVDPVNDWYYRRIRALLENAMTEEIRLKAAAL